MLFLFVSLARASDLEAARAALDAAGAPTSAADRIERLALAGGGSVVRVTPVIAGVPADVSHRVWIDRRGRAHANPAALPRPVPGDPMSGDRALALARAWFGSLPDARARLSWRPRGGAMRLVWTVDARAPIAGYAVPLLRIDALTGALLAIDEGGVHAAPAANAYLENPVVDPDPVVVSLPEATEALTDARVTLQQCRDLGETVESYFTDGKETFTTLDVHVCTTVPADGPTDGDYLYEPVPYPEDPARDEDDFAAPHTYWNVHRGLDWYDALGWTVPDGFDPLLYVTVNYRTPDLLSEETATDPGAALLPYDNAFSTGGYDDWNGAWVPAELVFGQGDDADFAYDADVIHHELGHYVVRTQDGPSWSPATSEGPSVQAPALNEGLADYFSCALHGEPWLAEYANGDDYIRNLDGPETCMSDLYGEPHYDSLPFSTALWAFREVLAEKDRATFDQAVLDSLAILGPNATFESAADTLVELADERLGAGTALAAELDARGVRACRARVAVVPGTEIRRFTQIPTWWEFGNLGPVPGYVQFVVDVPEGGAELTVSFDQSEFQGLPQYWTNVPQPVGVVGRPGDGIAWTVTTEKKKYDFGGKQYWFYADVWTSNAHRVAESVLTSVEPSASDPRYDLHHMTATWQVDEGGPYTFQFTNEFQRQVLLGHLALALTPLAAAGESAEPPLAQVAYESGAAGGCGCGRGGGSAAPWLAAAAALALIRRGDASASRSRSRSSRPCR
jgi:hypothetical protein